MPNTWPGNSQGTGWNREHLHSVDHGYEYELGPEMRPGKKLHEDLRERISNRIRDSYSHLEKRYPVWSKIENNLRAFVPLDAEEHRVKSRDPRKPVSIVMPVSYAIKQTSLAYLSSAFFYDSPMLEYAPREQGDVLSAANIEMLIDYQRVMKSWELAFDAQWGDALSLGYGAIAARWCVDRGVRRVRKQNGFNMLGMFIPTGEEFVDEEYVSFEGNQLDAISPWNYFPDPNAPVHRPDLAEFVAWKVETNRMALLAQERDTGDLFNCKYLSSIQDGRTHLTGNENRKEPVGSSNPMDVYWQYVRLVPEEWKLGTGKYPETWLFALAADSVIIFARRVKYNHGIFPVVVAAPDSDGRELLPVSRLEVGYGLQEAIDWLVTSHLKFLRKNANGVIIYDQGVVNGLALEEAGEKGGLVPLRKSLGGRDIRSAYAQLTVSDVTRGNVPDSQFLQDVHQRVLGAPDIIQGMVRSEGERRSALEARDARNGAMSRLEYTARKMSIQSLRSLGYIVAKHTQQFMTQETKMRVIGRRAEMLAKQYGISDYANISPEDIQCEFDVIPKDGSIPNPDNAMTMLQLFDRVSANPNLAMGIDLQRMLSKIARQAGVNDWDAFQVQAKVIDNESVMRQVDAGNMVPLEQLSNGQV